jgi:hypothetical protein
MQLAASVLAVWLWLDVSGDGCGCSCHAAAVCGSGAVVVCCWDAVSAWVLLFCCARLWPLVCVGV